MTKEKLDAVVTQAKRFVKLARRVETTPDVVAKAIGRAGLSVVADDLTRALAEMRKNS